MCVVCFTIGLAVSVSPVETEIEKFEREALMQNMLAEQAQHELELEEFLK